MNICKNCKHMIELPIIAPPVMDYCRCAKCQVGIDPVRGHPLYDKTNREKNPCGNCSDYEDKPRRRRGWWWRARQEG